MKTKFLTLIILLLPFISFSSTTDFTATSDTTISDITFSSTTTEMTIKNSSTAESFTFDSGVFTVTNPGTFKISSSDSTVKSIQISKDGSVVTCTENTTAGTTYTTLPTDSGIYTIRPSATTDCTNLCTTLDNTATYNTYPTCGAATCTSGYIVSGSGANATCVHSGGGSLPGTITPIKVTTPRPQTIYPDGTIVYHDSTQGGQGNATSTTPTPTPAPTKTLNFSFTKTLTKGQDNQTVSNLQQLLRELNFFTYPTNTGYYGTITEEAVQAFQCKHNIICTGTPQTTGYGVVGPKTRAKLNELLNSEKPTTNPNQTLIDSLQLQINELQEMVEELMEELEGMGE